MDRRLRPNSISRSRRRTFLTDFPVQQQRDAGPDRRAGAGADSANGNDGTTWSTPSYDANGWLAGTNGVGYGVAGTIATPIQGLMSNVNSSAYIRLPFTLTGASNIAQLTLRVRYDDGFAAFVNGREVLRVNPGGDLAFNSTAATNHSSTAFEEFPVGVGGALLQEGANVLGIQGLNVATNDADFFVLAEVIGVSRILESPQPLYMSVPTPGAANSFGVAYPGPVITDVGHLPNVPLDTEDLQVTARVFPSFFNVTNVTLRYRVMFSNEVSITMLDDGNSGDGAAGDGIYGAKIPASAASPGQMIRYAIRAFRREWEFLAVAVADEHSRDRRIPRDNR